ncbi:hypothetical protein LY76DRAFT_328304 [Colletotrichum caudatum]|nr:hypothetical protein LY76DRAFT_328304 [Colletotrichum caudatum]
MEGFHAAHRPSNLRRPEIFDARKLRQAAYSTGRGAKGETSPAGGEYGVAKLDRVGCLRKSRMAHLQRRATHSTLVFDDCFLKRGGGGGCLPRAVGVVSTKRLAVGRAEGPVFLILPSVPLPRVCYATLTSDGGFPTHSQRQTGHSVCIVFLRSTLTTGRGEVRLHVCLERLATWF